LNSRVLIFNTVPFANNASADLVIGQADFNSAVSTVSANGLTAGGRIYAGNGRLIVKDFNRVLIYNDTTVTPNINLTTPPVPIDGGRYRLTGNVFMNTNNQTYGLQKLSFDVNGTDNGSINVTGGRNDGGGNSIYDFTYDFDPTVGN